MRIEFMKSDTDTVAHLLNSRHFLDYCLANGAVIMESKHVQEALSSNTDNIMMHMSTIISEISLCNHGETVTVSIFSIADSEGDTKYDARYAVIRSQKEIFLVGWFHASKMGVIASKATSNAAGHLINYFSDVNWTCFDASPFSNSKSFD